MGRRRLGTLALLAVVVTSCRLFVDLDGLGDGAPLSPEGGAPDADRDAGDGAIAQDGGVDGSVVLEPGPGVVVSGIDGGSTVSVRVEGRYLLVFDESVGWQPKQWLDLSASSPGVDLGSSLGVSEPYELRETGDPTGRNNASSTNRVITVLETGPARAVVRTSYVNTTSVTTTAIDTKADYVLWANGRIAETATIARASGGPIADFAYVEFAHTNVSPSVTWDISEIAGHGFAFARKPPDTSNLLVASFEGETGIGHDEITTNRFWTAAGVPLPFGAGASVTRSWEITLWPGAIGASELADRVTAARTAVISAVSGASIDGTGYDRKQAAYVAKATGAAPVVLRIASGSLVFAPSFVIEGWAKPTFRIRNAGRILATSDTPASKDAAATWTASTNRLAFATTLKLPAAASDDARTFTIEP